MLGNLRYFCFTRKNFCLIGFIVNLSYLIKNENVRTSRRTHFLVIYLKNTITL